MKIAILAERYAASADPRWFLGVVLALVGKAGDFINDEVWHRLVQVVTNTKDLHEPAARFSLLKLRAGSSHEMLVKVAGYFLGEYGHLMHDEPPTGYAALLVDAFNRGVSHDSTRAIILSALAKIAVHPGSDDGLRQKAGLVFRLNAGATDVDLQQRAVEYATLTSTHIKQQLWIVMDEMPEFPRRESKLEKSVDIGDNTGDVSVKHLSLERGEVSAIGNYVSVSQRITGRSPGTGAVQIDDLLVDDQTNVNESHEFVPHVAGEGALMDNNSEPRMLLSEATISA